MKNYIIREFVLQTYTVVVHEMLHILGFGHEHQRPDRDDFITVLWSNIKNKYAFAYFKTEWNTTDVDDYLPECPSGLSGEGPSDDHSGCSEHSPF